MHPWSKAKTTDRPYNMRPIGLTCHLTEYQIFYMDFLSEGIIFAYQQAHGVVKFTILVDPP